MEGVVFDFLVAPIEVVKDASGAVSGLRCERMKLGDADASGRRRPEPIPGSEFVLPCEVVVSAVGMEPDDEPYERVTGDAKGHRIKVDPITLQSDHPFLFAAGDVEAGATDITHAIGHGRRAAYMIDSWLHERPLDGFPLFDDPLGVVDTSDGPRPPAGLHPARAGPRPTPSTPARRRDFAELEPAMTEAEALAGSGGCLDCGVCSECQECVKACPADAIRLDMKDTEVEVEVAAVVVSTGYKLFAADLKPEYGYGTYANVITGMQMDRLLAPTRPFNTILRPGDGKVPGPHRLHLVHRLARQAGGQPAVLEALLHVLDQAEPAHHGLAPAGRRDHALHGHARRREALRRVLRAGQGHGRDLHQGPGLQGHREGERRPGPALRGHRERRPDHRGRVRPRRPRRRDPAQPRGRAALQRREARASTSTTTSPSPTRSSSPARPTSPGVFVAGHLRRAPRTSSTRSCTPGPPSRRSPPI